LEDLEPDRFGYRSVHFVVSLSKDRAKLTEWGVFSGKRAEIQLRTATQHAWAAVEHKLSYKRTREAPRDLRRRLLRLSALFELADEQFSGVRKQLEDVEAQYSDEVRGGNLDLPLDKASLEAFIAENAVVGGLITKARKAGIKVADSQSPEYESDRDIDLRDLLTVLDRLNISTVAELDAALRKKSSMAAAIKAVASDPEFEYVQWRSPVDLLTILILCQQKAPIDLVASIYHADTVNAFRATQGARG
jgi:putative GTP pyrophosphokinase